MDDLLEKVLAAHGGLDTWARISTLTAGLSLGGPFWAARGWPDAATEQTVILDTRNERITYQPFPGPGMASEFTSDPERITIKDADGSATEERVKPRAGYPFPFDSRATRWDAVQVAYFASCAMWNYVTEPFVFTCPGVVAEEIDPWDEAGDTWRSPSRSPCPTTTWIRSSTSTRSSCCGAWTTPPTSPATRPSPITPTSTRPSRAWPSRRLVHLRGPDGVANQDFAPITVDIHHITATPA